jgi:hypothetical protein
MFTMYVRTKNMSETGTDLEHTMSTVTDEQFRQLLCYYKGITTPCTQCGGVGTYMYSNTATWRQSGIAGQAFTRDVCDHCWGSGDEDKHGCDLRKMTLKHRRRDRVDALKHISAMLGCNMSTTKVYVSYYADVIATMAKKRKPPIGDDIFLYKHMTDSFASLLRQLTDIDDILEQNADV